MLLLLLLFGKTDVSKKMKNKFYEVICVAPWTSLDLSRQSAVSDE